MVYPRVLVLSNNCFSKTDSNGRTLGNFFLGWPQDRLAQFYIQNATPDFSYCQQYCRVTDYQALKALFGKRTGCIVCQNEFVSAEASPVTSSAAGGRNALTMLIRDMVWSLGAWKTEEYKRWLQVFSPEVVLLQAGDCAFMFRLAMEIAEQFGAKLVIYNTEGYYFKEYDYFRGTGLAHLCYPVFCRKLRMATKEAYQKADHCIFNCDTLKEDFSKEFELRADVIYTATDVQPVESVKIKTDRFIASYAGNMGVGRGKSLVDVASILHSIDSRYVLDVYGSIPNDEVKQLFDRCEGLRFHGRIGYDQVKTVMVSSDLLIHIESFDPYYRKDLKYAFSTKIADCLASNTCFLVYAPEEFAETQYLLRNEAAYVACNPHMLKEQMKLLISQPEARSKFCSKAAVLAKKNHNLESAVMCFQDILCATAAKGV